ncbi:hypothetical protein HJC99_04205 [Candidatus Saccharibacteria bacterium]|nr:hypothetical protein [Candidatus Saccharibacteria bacterium]
MSDATSSLAQAAPGFAKYSTTPEGVVGSSTSCDAAVPCCSQQLAGNRRDGTPVTTLRRRSRQSHRVG